jgi:hypothetical protein
MPSNYVGDPATATATLSLMTGGDQPTAQLFRVPLERLLDNDAKNLNALWGAGADNTGGATITLGAGRVFNLITSTTAITSFVFTEDVTGRGAIIRFNTARTLTHNASTLIIPGATNITTAAGDVMHITRTTTGVRVDWYTKATGFPILQPAASDTVAGVLEIATQAEQETATDVVRAVSPGRQHFHPSAAKFWAYVTVSAGTPTLAASYNVTGIVDDAPGVLTVTIATDFSSANWASVVTVRSSVNRFTMTTSQLAGSVTAAAIDPATTVAADPTAWSVIGFGDHA